MLEGEQHDSEEGDRGEPDVCVQIGDADREQRREELGGEHRDHDLRPAQSVVPLVVAVSGRR